MAFRFALAAVLRLREIEEQREERLLSQILQQITQAEEALAQVERSIVAARAAHTMALASGIKAAEMRFGYAGLTALDERKAAAEQQLAQWRQLREKQIQVHRAAHQRRELLETMREDQRVMYAAGRAKGEQKSLDDIFLARRPRS